MKYDKVRLNEIEQEIRTRELKNIYIVKKESLIDDERIKIISSIKYLLERVPKSIRNRSFPDVVDELYEKRIELDRFLKKNYKLDTFQYRCNVRKYEIDYSGLFVSYQDTDIDEAGFSSCLCSDCQKSFLSSSEFPICPFCNSYDTFYF